MPDIDISKADTQTAIILLYQNIESLIQDFQEFKNMDKEWKEEYKTQKKEESERLKKLEVFMIQKTTENGFNKERSLQDQERIKDCYKRFQKYDKVCHWVENFQKLFWFIITVFLTGIITNILSYFKFVPKDR